MLRRSPRTVAALCAVLLAGTAASMASAQLAPPTFQGSLNSSGFGADGSFDFRLSLYSTETGGTALQQVLQPGVAVTRGIFTVPLRFDPQLFSAGEPRYLGIEVRPGGSGSYTAINPRQALGVTPVALSVPGIVSVPNLTPDQDIAGDATDTNGLTGVWQSFTCTASGRLRAVTLKLNNETFGVTRNVTATIFAGEGTGGTAVGTAVVGVAGSQSAPRFVTFHFNVGIAVNAGDKLTISLTQDILLNWYISSGDAYAGGRSSVSATKDFAISTFVEIAGSYPSLSVPGGFATDSLNVGAYQGGTVGSAVKSFSKQVTLGGTYNTGANSGSAVKLLIADYDNENGADIYPIYVEDENNTVDFFLRKQGSSSGGTTTAFLNGNLGVGAPSPNARLHVSTDAVNTGWQVQLTNTAALPSYETGMRMSDVGFFEITNRVNGFTKFARLDSNGAWSAVSDARMKTDITPFEGALDAALGMHPVRFRWIGDGDADFGVIAQELRAVLPQAVVGDEARGSLTVDYSKLSVVAIGAIQEQQRQIKALKIEAGRREAENAELRARLDRLEKRLQ